MKKRQLFFLATLSFLLIFNLAYAQIDYINGVVKATGIGAVNPDLPMATARPAAMRAAKADAYRNLLELVKGVYINSETTVENFMLSNDVIYTQVEGIVKGVEIADTRYMSDGTVEIDVVMPLTGDFADAIYGEMGGGTAIAEYIRRCPCCGQPLPPGVTLPEEYKDKMAPPSTQIYTGLIVDASGLGVQPAMAPKILNEDGKEVYGTGFVSREYAVQMGVAGYSKDIEKAKLDERVTDNPFVIKGLKVSGTNKTDIIISNADAANLHSVSENLAFMQKCRVIIIVD